MKLSSLFCLCLAVMILFLFQVPVSAEVYKFTDTNGETHYTNDPGCVPRQYRDDIEVEQETRTYSYSNENYDSSDYEERSDAEGSEDGEQPEGNSGAISDLQARQTAFDQEFKELEEERARLDKAMRNAETREDREKVNIQTMEFNNRYKDFHMRRKAFKKEVQEHNEQVRQDMEKRLKEYNSRQASQEDEQ